MERDSRVPTADRAVTLSADVYRPVTDRRVPALITVIPYRKDYIAGATYDAPAHWFAAQGFASVIVDLRGTGASDGQRRPEFDPGEGDDGVATIEWVAAQPWCDGAVGMWGMSYAANTTLRTASRQPAALRAIIAIAHTLDAGRHSVHPDGARGDLHALVNRGTSMLLQQLLPPLVDFATLAAQRRWSRRLRDTEPALLDYARHGLDDPLWSERAISGDSIVVPTLCLGGWRDSFADGLIEAYESIRGPKRLIMGPWGHLLPHDSAHGPIDFLAVALRWWQDWLCDVDPSVRAQPTVIASLGDSCWRGYDTWPPAESTLLLAADGDALGPAFEPRQVGPRQAVGRYTPDATIGTLRGLPGLGLGESCPPQDQHDDDQRCVCATGAPIATDLLIGGRPEVTVRLDTPVRRVAIRLCAVDPAGRSTLVSSGVLRCNVPTTDFQVRLRPVHQLVPAGHRLRIAISDSDFPRLTPLPGSVAFVVTDLSVSVPLVPVGKGTAVRLPAPGRDVPPGRTPITWTIARQPTQESAEVTVTTDTAAVVSRDGHRYRIRTTLLATARRGMPEAARCEGTQCAEVDLASGERIIATATVRCTQDTVWAHGEVTVDGLTMVSRTWYDVLCRE